MKPIVLIHGYSAESSGTTRADIVSIYGDLPRELKRAYGRNNVVAVNVSRYISLEDGITLDDIARAFDQALQARRHRRLLDSGFHAIVHSTGAIVIRNWLRKFSMQPSPLSNLVYLAGANFGSGWAHLGKGQLAKWGRFVFGGDERGIQVLSALELGSSETIDLHLHFLDAKHSLRERFGVLEHIIIGTQADTSFFAAPIRYAKEDGSDGVVRVSASNLNFTCLRFEPTDEAHSLTTAQMFKQQERNLDQQTRGRRHLYEITTRSDPGRRRRPVIPFGIPFNCTHSGERFGIISGSATREQVLRMIDLSLKSTNSSWSSRIEQFQRETANSYELAREALEPGWIESIFVEPRAQYDAHAQLIFRLRDQDGRGIENFDVFFNIVPSGHERYHIKELIEHTRVNGNTIVFYLRVLAFDEDADEDEDAWVDRRVELDDVYLEISASEPQTSDIVYLPLRHTFTNKDLQKLIRPHQTTIIDVVMLRCPGSEVYRLVRA